jgi:hypothetical protein
MNEKALGHDPGGYITKRCATNGKVSLSWMILKEEKKHYPADWMELEACRYETMFAAFTAVGKWSARNHWH